MSDQVVLNETVGDAKVSVRYTSANRTVFELARAGRTARLVVRQGEMRPEPLITGVAVSDGMARVWLYGYERNGLGWLWGVMSEACGRMDTDG